MKILLFDYNNVLSDVAVELQARGHTLLPLDGKKTTAAKADVIVVWNETALGFWRDWIQEMQKKGKRVVLVQHGRRGTSRIFPPFNESLVSDVVCVWGENDRKRMESCGVAPDRIRVTGTPIFKHLKGRVPHQGKNVVFSPEHWDVDVVENMIVMGQLRKLQGAKVTCKLIEGEHNPAEYLNPISSDRAKPGHLEVCAEVLSTADAVVAISESTFELMAEILGIPVIIADIWIPKACNGDDRYKEYHREYSPACLMVQDMKKLNDTILAAMKEPQFLAASRKEIAILDGGVDIPNPTEKICQVIEEVK